MAVHFLTILALCLSVTGLYAGQVNIAPLLIEQRSAERHLVNMLTQPRAASVASPTQTKACFDYYLPLLDECSAQYEKDYYKCYADADLAKATADAKTKGYQNTIQGLTDDSCNALAACGTEPSTTEVFECYNTVGSQSSKEMYWISQNASEALVFVDTEYRAIQYECDKCTTTANRKYQSDTTHTYEDLQSCLDGKTGVPESSSSSSTSTSTSTYTTESAETTVEDSNNEDMIPLARFAKKHMKVHHH